MAEGVVADASEEHTMDKSHVMSWSEFGVG